MEGLPGDLQLDDVKESGEVLHNGKFGAIFRASWLGTPAVVKRIHGFAIRNQTGDSTETYKLFLKEAKIHAFVRHPNIVQLLGTTSPEHRNFSPGMVLESLPLSLRQRYRESPALALGDEIRVMLDVVHALEYLHSIGLLHLNVTTASVLLTSPRAPHQAKLSGVGAAWSQVTAQYCAVSTRSPAYTAPEKQLLHAQGSSWDYEVDSFAIGVTAWAMTVRREPTCVITLDHVTSLSSVPDGHPLGPYIEACTSIDPLSRPKMAPLSRRLGALLKEHGTPAVATDLPGMATQASKDEKVATDLPGMATQASKDEKVGVLEAKMASFQRDNLLKEENLARLQDKVDRLEATQVGMASSCQWRVKCRVRRGMIGVGRPALLDGFIYWTMLPSAVPTVTSPTLMRMPLESLGDGDAWQPVAMPTRTVAASRGVFACDSDLFLVATTPCSISRYTVWRRRGERWETVTSLPEAKKMFAAGVVGNRLFVIGGIMRVDRQHIYQQTCHSLDVTTSNAKREWRRWPDVPVKTAWGSIVADGDTVHLIGYASDPKADADIATATGVLSLDVSTPENHHGDWTASRLPPIQLLRTGACIAGQDIIVAGGYRSVPPRGGNVMGCGSPVPTTKRCSVAGQDWDALPDLLYARYRPYLFHHGDVVFCLGGVDDREKFVSEIEVFNLPCTFSTEV